MATDGRGRVAVVIPAAGGGRRMGGVRKQYLELAGEPILLHAVRPFLGVREVETLVVVLPADDAADPPGWLASLDPRVRIVAGGAERSDSVWNGLAQVPDTADVVLVHDGARPLVSRALIERVMIATVAGAHGVVPGLPVTDTIKEVSDDGRVVRTLVRSSLRAVQTPQAFPRGMIQDAYRRAREEGLAATDCAALAERCGYPVIVVDGDIDNIKVTTPADLEDAETLLRKRVDRAGPFA